MVQLFNQRRDVHLMSTWNAGAFCFNAEANASRIVLKILISRLFCMLWFVHPRLSKECCNILFLVSMIQLQMEAKNTSTRQNEKRNKERVSGRKRERERESSGEESENIFGRMIIFKFRFLLISGGARQKMCKSQRAFLLSLSLSLFV